MTSTLFTQLLCSLGVASILLLLGTYLRAKIRIFQTLFLPASVIGGFIGLLLGPIILGDYAVVRVPKDFVTIWSLIPGVLIVPIIASIPLGLFMEPSKGIAGSGAKTVSNVVKATCIYMGVLMLQNVVGFGSNAVITAIDPGTNLYRTFGFELGQGYWGGHGTAGAVGKILEGLGIPYWQTAQGITVTTATVGLVGGMLIGIILINAATRAGKTAILKKPGQIPQDMLQGYQPDVAKQGSVGRETTINSSIETITLHLAIILSGCGIAYFIMGYVKAMPLPRAITSLPVWIYAMFVMLLINAGMIKCKLNFLYDGKIKSRIIGTLSDFAIVCAIASVPVKAIAAYVVPLAIICVLGFITTYYFIFLLYNRLNKDDYAFERSIIIWGTGTGVIINGIMLLKICDPDFKTPALSDFSMGFALMSIARMVSDPLTLGVLAAGSTMDNFWVSAALLAGFVLIAFLSNKMAKKEPAGEREEAAAA